MHTPNHSARTLSVLVVDDDADTAESLAELLTLYGYNVCVARDGTAALRQEEAERPDVVLLDLRMPGLDGCEVARRIRERCGARGKRPLLVAVTGCEVGDVLLRPDRRRFDLHLVKPVETPALIHVLERFRRVLCAGSREAALDPSPEEESAQYAFATSPCV